MKLIKKKYIDLTKSVANMKNISCSPRKLRLVANIIRNKKVEYSIYKLNHIKNKGAIIIKNLLLSAISNWKIKNLKKDINKYNFYIEKILVNQGYKLKKIRPAPQGRGNKVRKKYSNLYITIISKS